jgi:hypothetical protein
VKWEINERCNERSGSVCLLVFILNFIRWERPLLKIKRSNKALLKRSRVTVLIIKLTVRCVYNGGLKLEILLMTLARVLHAKDITIMTSLAT